MSRKAFNQHGYLTAFQKQKVAEIQELAKENINPFRVTMATSLGSHGFMKDDVRNYYAANPQPFFQTIAG